MNEQIQIKIPQPKKPATRPRNKTRTCPTCHATMITGPDARTAAIIVDLDPTPLSYPQALACIITNRKTYLTGPSGDITRLTPAALLHKQPNPPHPIHAEHKCRQPIPNTNPQPETEIETADHERPPF